jgi:hypothetical protein
MEKALIISHATAGGLTLLSGLLASFVGKKGGELHKTVGGVFLWSMAWIFVSTLLIVAFVRFNFFLTIIAVFSFYMTFSGVRVLKIKKTMKPLMVDWIAAIITVLFCFSLIIYGIGILITSPSNIGFLILCGVFGFVTANTAWINIKGFRKAHQQEKMWWWFAHMNLLGGAFIASITAFLVQNARLFEFLGDFGWVLWLLPAAVGSPLIAYWTIRYRKQFKMGKFATTQKAQV